MSDENPGSPTKIDMAKVTQMLDAGWHVILFKNGMSNYSAQATHKNAVVMGRTLALLVATMAKNTEFLAQTGQTAEEAVDEMDFDDGYVITDDFSPEQALTRLAYKLHGEIL